MRRDHIIYPFTAIVGQEDMKLALLLNVINPAIGGLLIRGDKGTAKSTAVRALADLLPAMRATEGCPFGCDPGDPAAMCDQCAAKAGGEEPPAVERKMRVVELPVNATEDRVVGTLDIEYAIKKGEKRFEPGILAAANRNILYVDEVNLLDDHVVDVLLDAAAMGVNTVEREGVSYSHPARFILVGTMNPEEGDIRPQLLDRFGLVVDVAGEADVRDRTEVIRRRLSYEKDSEEFARQYEADQAQLAGRIAAARAVLPRVAVSDAVLDLAAAIAIELKVDGHRADITMVKTALTLAAFAGRQEVLSHDIREAAYLALPHRLRRTPFEEGRLYRQQIDALAALKEN